MPLSPLREELIGRVKEGDGRNRYRELMEAIPEKLEGLAGHLSEHLYLRIIKGTQRLKLNQVLLTNEGLCTDDGMIADCGAALVKMESGIHGIHPYDVKRYAGKESGDVHRIKTDYYSQAGMFRLSTDTVRGKFFDPQCLQPTEGPIVRAKMGDSILEGVLVAEDNLLTEHIRACLAPHEKDVTKIRVMLRHPSFKRISDTVDDERDDIRTLFTDGSQLHVQNSESILYENQFLSAPMPEDASRAAFSINGLEILPFIEDAIGSIRIRCEDGSFARVCFADLTPRCKDAQQDPLTGELMVQGNEAKSWRIANRPRIFVTEKRVPNHTSGGNAHADPETLGATGKKLITGLAEFVVEGEKAKLRR